MCDRRLWSGDGERLQRQLTTLGFAVHHADTTRDDTIGGMAATLLRESEGALVPLGFPMGGIVALEAVRQAPARIAGLVKEAEQRSTQRRRSGRQANPRPFSQP
ncbi:hypothetical protein [Sphingomonas bacterium]|uniref:hypothetical protein n=1 Tax=Sphingomonas bacterium TaxID=1895847 RepID=UPI001576D213|nr:hypothetical protein [Sphingomonas bacterium]